MKKYKLTTNLGLKIIAFVFSAFLWLIVVNLDNPVSSRTFTEIPVTIVNDDIITSAGDVYQVVGEQTVSVVVYANREVRQHLSPDDIVATADIREMDTSTGLVPITITIPDYSGQYQSAEAVPRNRATAALTTAVRIPIRILRDSPDNVRASMSRPIQSVPKRCCRLGLKVLWEKSVSTA